MVTTLQLGIALLAASLSHAKGDLPQDSLSRSYGPTTLRKRSQTLVDCLTNKTVPITAISDPSYVPFNRRLDYTPAVIVYPSTPQQVSDAVLCAGYTGIKVQPKSGGHSYASFSSGGQDGSLIIDLEPFQEINVDNSTGVAKVGGGVRLGNLALGIYAQGRRALPHGSCPGYVLTTVDPVWAVLLTPFQCRGWWPLHAWRLCLLLTCLGVSTGYHCWYGSRPGEWQPCACNSQLLSRDILCQ